jgi:hypothetical protein
MEFLEITAIPNRDLWVCTREDGVMGGLETGFL